MAAGGDACREEAIDMVDVDFVCAARLVCGAMEKNCGKK